MLNEQIGQTMEHIIRVQLAVDDNGQALSGKFVDHGEHTERPSIVSGKSLGLSVRLIPQFPAVFINFDAFTLFRLFLAKSALACPP